MHADPGRGAAVCWQLVRDSSPEKTHDTVHHNRDCEVQVGLFDFFKSKSRSSGVTDIAMVMVTLEVSGDQALFILLSQDGTINRMGAGREDSTDKDLFIGRGDLGPFNRVRDVAGPVIDNWIGGYGAPEKKGKECKLVVGFQKKDGEELMSQWEYGSESIGPPPDVTQLVICAVNATESWWEKQKEVAAGG